MSIPVPTPARGWARVHRAALAIVLLSIALAAAVSLLAVRLAAGSSPAPTTTVPAGHLQSGYDLCHDVRPGRPC